MSRASILSSFYVKGTCLHILILIILLLILLLLLDQVTKPWMCQSFGDPHISPFSFGRSDLIIPGSQQPGTYTLSKIGNQNDFDYLLIQADQQLCSPLSNIYCNKRAALKVEGKVIEIGCDKVIINGVVTTISGTYLVGNVSIIKKGRGMYLVSYPNGSIKTVCSNNGNVDITIIINGGQQPNGGVCTHYPSGGQSLSSHDFLLSCTYQLIFYCILIVILIMILIMILRESI